MLEFLAIFMSSAFVANQLGTAKVKITFTHEAFIHTWKRRYFLSWEKNIKIPWNMIDSFLFHEDRTFDSFIINLTNNIRYKINRLNILPFTGDFKKFVEEFPELSNKYRNNTNLNIEPVKIKEGPSIYTSKPFKWVIYSLYAGYLILVFTKILNPDTSITWHSLGIIGSGLVFYSIMIANKKG